MIGTSIFVETIEADNALLCGVMHHVPEYKAAIQQKHRTQ